MSDPFDRHFARMDKMMDNPGRTVLKFGAFALVLNLIFWLVIIAAVVFGLTLIF